jgi:hypothetical protein
MKVDRTHPLWIDLYASLQPMVEAADRAFVVAMKHIEASEQAVVHHGKELDELRQEIDRLKSLRAKTYELARSMLSK